MYKKILISVIALSLILGFSVSALAREKEESNLEAKMDAALQAQIAAIQAKPTDLVAPIKTEAEKVVDLTGAWLAEFVKTGAPVVVMTGENSGYAAVDGTLKDFGVLRLTAGYVLGGEGYFGLRVQMDKLFDIEKNSPFAFFAQLEPGVGFYKGKIQVVISYDWRGK